MKLKTSQYLITGCIPVLLLLATTVASADCSRAKDVLRSEERERVLLIAKQSELREEFNLQVKEDFDVQGAGLFDEIHRNAAIKARFALKQIDRQIAQREAKIAAVRRGYCEDCLPNVASINSPVEYCKYCKTEALCK